MGITYPYLSDVNSTSACPRQEELHPSTDTVWSRKSADGGCDGNYSNESYCEFLTRARPEVKLDSLVKLIQEVEA